MKLIKHLFLFLLLFIIICRPQFVFIPLGVNRFFGILGLLTYVFDKRNKRNIIGASGASVWRMMKYVLPLVIVSFVSLLVNNTSDFYFPFYAISIFLGFFSAYFFAYVLYRFYGEVNETVINRYYTIVIVVFVLMALLCFFKPSVYEFFISIENYDEIALEAMERTEGTRLVGIGANFFTAAVINGICLIILSVYIVTYRHSVRDYVILFVAFAIISAVGMMMARTTVFGAALGLAIMVVKLFSDRKNLIRMIVSMSVVFIAVFMIQQTMDLNLSDKSETLVNFGFEMLKNKEEGGNLETHSMLGVYEMLKIVPNDLPTWLIGDGLWVATDGGYYKHVDLGYLRDVWYFGLTGTLFVFLFYYKTIKMIFYDRRLFYPNHKILLLTLFLFILIVNGKGPGDPYFCIIPYFFCKSKKNIIEQPC